MALPQAACMSTNPKMRSSEEQEHQVTNDNTKVDCLWSHTFSVGATGSDYVHRPSERHCAKIRELTSH